MVKYFSGYGHFRGVVQSYDDTYFSVLYTDGDCEEVDVMELQELISLGLPFKRGGRRRRRRLELAGSSHPKASSKVGEKYQATLGPYLGEWTAIDTGEVGVDERGGSNVGEEMWEQLWDPTQNEHLGSQVRCCVLYFIYF